MSSNREEKQMPSASLSSDKITTPDGITMRSDLANKRDTSPARVMTEQTRTDDVNVIDTSAPALSLSALHLHPRIIEALKKNGISGFFPVQAIAIPAIMQARGVKDVCVAAPTGSGKTLAYVLPIVQVLQVASVFRAYCEPLGLKVDVALGQSSFAAEQARLCNVLSNRSSNSGGGVGGVGGSSASLRDAGGSSAVDVLVATPGRLVDHLHGTRGFTLQHLQFLVIDEADRLLTQSYQDWTVKVLSAIVSARDGALRTHEDGSPLFDDTCPRATQPRDLWPAPFQKLLFSATLTRNPQHQASLALRSPVFFQATASRRRTFQVPQSLEEYMVVSAPGAKPLALLALLALHQHRKQLFDALLESKELTPEQATLAAQAAQVSHTAISSATSSSSSSFSSAQQQPRQVIVFTSSLESTHRLSRLLELFHSDNAGLETAEFSSCLPQDRRTRVLEDFRRGKIQILVCSDAMARGMDLPAVSCVVNYDVPVHLRTYIHRVGRTARANKRGVAVSLVRGPQVRHFMDMTHRAANSRTRERTLPEPLLAALVPPYKVALTGLQRVISQEKIGTLKPGHTLRHPRDSQRRQQPEPEQEGSVESKSKRQSQNKGKDKSKTLKMPLGLARGSDGAVAQPVAADEDFESGLQKEKTKKQLSKRKRTEGDDDESENDTGERLEGNEERADGIAKKKKAKKSKTGETPSRHLPLLASLDVPVEGEALVEEDIAGEKRESGKGGESDEAHDSESDGDSDEGG